MNSYREEFPAVPFVLVVDRSSSMKENGGIDLINSSLPEMVATLMEMPEVEETASVGLISFATTAHIHRRITPLTTGFDVPEFRADGRTSYAAPLQALRSMIAEDLPRLGSRGHRPIVFFITDGNPNVEDTPVWKSARDHLLEEGFRLRPKLVTLGCGNVDQGCLEQLASEPRLAEWEGGPTKEALKTILRTVKGTITGFTGGKAAYLDRHGDDLLARIFEFDAYDIGDDDVFEYLPA
jgi:uncharacterized protein YegL